MKHVTKTTIYRAPLDPSGIPLYLREGDNEITAFNAACAFCRRHDYHSWRADTFVLYLLRAKGSDPAHLLTAVQQVRELPKSLKRVFPTISFYNEFGRRLYGQLRKKGEDYRDCLIRCLAKDCQDIAGKTGGYLSGYGSSHVWIAERLTSRRVLIIHF